VTRKTVKSTVNPLRTVQVDSVRDEDGDIELGIHYEDRMDAGIYLSKGNTEALIAALQESLPAATETTTDDGKPDVSVGDRVLVIEQYAAGSAYVGKTGVVTDLPDGDGDLYVCLDGEARSVYARRWERLVEPATPAAEEPVAPPVVEPTPEQMERTMALALAANVPGTARDSVTVESLAAFILNGATALEHAAAPTVEPYGPDEVTIPALSPAVPPRSLEVRRSIRVDRGRAVWLRLRGTGGSAVAASLTPLEARRLAATLVQHADAFDAETAR
jgi:hypothetical protein